MHGLALQATRLLVGCLISFFGISILTTFTGSSDFASSLINIFLISVICTLGLSLFIWIPLFWMVGFLALEIFGLLNRSLNHRGDAGEGGTSDRQAVFAVSTDIQAMVSYINQSRVHGATDQQIATRLRAKGWTEGEINHAFQQVSQPRNEP